MATLLNDNNLLIVGNFSSDTGYAWRTIEEYFVALGEFFLEKGCRVLVCYPKVDEISDRIASAKLEVLEFDFAKSSLTGLYRFMKRHEIRVLYLTDQPVYSVKYLICRLAGVKRIIVHDRIAGGDDIPGPLKRTLKTLVNYYPLLSADRAVAVSEFIRQRLLGISCFPAGRTVKIWNGIDIERFRPVRDSFVFRRFGIPLTARIVFASSRADRKKGIPVLIEAADILINQKKIRDLYFLYCGDGYDLAYFKELVSRKGLEKIFICAGESQDVWRILAGVHVVVVPSVCQEAFGLSVVEAMACGRVVVASRIGGIAEIIRDGVDGHLISAGAVDTLAEKIADVLEHAEDQQRVGLRARRSVVEKFNISDKKQELVELFSRVCFEDGSLKE